LETLVAQNALILQSQFAGRGTADLSMLVGGGGGESASLTGARGAAALEVHRRNLVENPEMVTQTIRGNMAKAVGGDPHAPSDAVAYMRHHGGFRNHADLGHVVVMVAELWNELELSNIPLAHAKVGLLLLAIEQAALNSRWELATLMSFGSEPDFHMMSRVSKATLLRPHSRLADPRWAVAAQAYISNAASSAEAFRKFKGKGKGKDDDEKGN